MPRLSALALALVLSLLAAPRAAAGAGQQIVFDLAPFEPDGIVGEIQLVSLAEGVIEEARLDATLLVAETDPWAIDFSFVLPTGAVGFSSQVEGWSGAGTFTKTIVTDDLDGPVAPTPGLGFWSAFASWSNQTLGTGPGGTPTIVPADAQFTELKLTLTLAACPNGDPDAPWTDVGGALAGSAGTPQLAGQGSLCPLEPGALLVSEGAPGAPAVIVLGASELALPVLGGVLVPQPDALLGGLVLDGSGAATFPFTWPGDAVAGTELWLQAWIVDAGAPAGLAASNGLRATSP